MTLDELRRHLDELDRQLLQIIADRQATSREIARVKRATGYPTRDYARERDVIVGARNNAAEHRRVARGRRDRDAAADPLLADHPGAASVAAHGSGSGRRALVIGGAGKMGGWFASVSELAGVRGRGGGSEGRRPGVEGHRRLARRRR